MWVRGSVWGFNLRFAFERGDGGRVTGVGVRITARKGSVLERAASVMALMRVGAVSSVGVFIQVKEFERKCGSGSVRAPR